MDNVERAFRDPAYHHPASLIHHFPDIAHHNLLLERTREEMPQSRNRSKIVKLGALGRFRGRTKGILGASRFDKAASGRFAPVEKAPAEAEADAASDRPAEISAEEAKAGGGGTRRADVYPHRDDAADRRRGAALTRSPRGTPRFTPTSTRWARRPRRAMTANAESPEPDVDRPRLLNTFRLTRSCTRPGRWPGLAAVRLHQDGERHGATLEARGRRRGQPAARGAGIRRVDPV